MVVQLMKPLPVCQSNLYIGPDKSFVMKMTFPMPNRWFRFWQWLLLGWWWEAEEQRQETRT